MYSNQNSRQILFLLLCAASAPVFQFAAKGSWMQMIVLFIASCLLAILPKKDIYETKSTLLCILHFITVVILLCAYGQESSKAWEKAPVLVPTVLLILAYITNGRTGKVGGSLVWGILVIYGILLGSGLKDLQIKRIDSKFGEFVWELIPILLIIESLGLKRKVKIWSNIGFLLISLIAIFWIHGNLTIEKTGNLFYSAGQSVSGIGSITRLDGLISIILTIGWYLLFSVLLESINELKGKRWTMAATIIAEIMILFNIKITWQVLTGIAFAMWIIVPGLLHFAEKKS